MPEPSQIHFPLRGNASALIAGAGVAAVRRRILAAALLTDRVVLEDGLYFSWAGPTGGATTISRTPPPELLRWQSPRQRGHATGSTHYVAMRPSDAPEETPLHTVIQSPATFSWRATFEPFRAELPASAASWLDFGHLADEQSIGEIVKGWKGQDRMAELTRYGLERAPQPPDGPFVRDAIIDAAYHDLAVGCVTGSAISIDYRHGQGLRVRVDAGDAQPVGGAYALSVLLPTGFTWDDVPDLRRNRALQSYRDVLRDVEAEALDGSRSLEELDRRIRAEYARRLVAARARGIPFKGRAALAAIGIVVGTAAGIAAPVAGIAAGVGQFGAGELLGRVARPRWLAIDRRLRGQRTGL